MASTDTQRIDAGAVATENETQNPFERAQEANSLATTFERQAMYVRWEVEDGHRSESVSLNERMSETMHTANEYFGHEAYFDYRGFALHPETSGVGPEDISSIENVACLSTAVRIADMDHTATREMLIDMRALALARDEARDKLTSRSTLMREAENYRRRAIGEVDAEAGNIDGCLEACQEIKSLMENQLEEKQLIDRAIKAGKERENAQEVERVTKQAREQEKQKASKMIDAMLDILQTTYGTPTVSLSGSKGLFGQE